MGLSRKTWQDFKKRVPEFERSKKFKSDFGPQLDSVESDLKDIEKQLDGLIRRIEKIGNDTKSIIAAADGYKTVAKEMKLSAEKEAEWKRNGPVNSVRQLGHFAHMVNRKSDDLARSSLAIADELTGYRL